MGNSNDEINFPHRLLLIDTEVSKTRITLSNGSSTNIKLSKTKLFKMAQLRGFLFGPPNIFGSPIK